MELTGNRRIIANILANYSVSLFQLACGFITARWAVTALGLVDYGLYGVVGGLTAFVSFFNDVLAVSVGRFYGVSVGRERASGGSAEALAECRKWFSIAVGLHTLLPLVLVAVGYPIGEWLVRNWLRIPPERIGACVWIFRFVCLTCFANMVTVPLRAMYKAHQKMAELTVYGYFTTVINMGFLYYMITHPAPGYWLARLGAWDCLMALLPTAIIAARSYFIFPECRLNVKYWTSWGDVRRLATFTGWYVFGILGNLVRGQSMSLLVNKFLGAAANASVNLAGSLAGKTRLLSGSLRSSFAPAITNAYGAGDLERMTTLFYAICKFSSLLTLVVAIPACVESHELMILWLKTPPPASPELMVFLAASIVLEHITMGHWMVISAKGQVALYQFLVGLCFMSAFPLCYVFLKCGCGVFSVGYTLVATYAGAVLLRLWAVNRLFGISPRRWTLRIFMPLTTATACAAAAGLCARLWLPPSLLRVIVSTAFVETVFLPFVWFVVLDASERVWAKEKILQRIVHLGRKP